MDLHFWFIGHFAGRLYIVNVPFLAVREDTGERLAPIEYDFDRKNNGLSNRQSGGGAHSALY